MTGLAAAAVAHASRVRCRRPGDSAILFETADRAELAALAAALATTPSSGATCACAGTIIFELEGHAEPRVIKLHHGESLRWDHSGGNLPLTAPEDLLAWLVRHDMAFVRDEYLASRAHAEEDGRSAARWKAALPASLQPFFEDMRRGSAIDPRWTAAIMAELPDPVERARVLLALFGSGAGPWSGYPSWESVPAQWLVETPLPVLSDALGDAGDSRRVAGALRLFASWEFRGRKKQLAKLSPELRERLLAHAEAIEDDARREQVMQVLAPRA